MAPADPSQRPAGQDQRHQRDAGRIRSAHDLEAVVDAGGGKNVGSLNEYRSIYEQSVQTILAELEVAKRRIEALSPEAAIPKDIRPEYQELKDEIKKLGGTKQIRELLAAEEGTNRQAFLQTKRVVAT